MRAALILDNKTYILAEIAAIDEKYAIVKVKSISKKIKLERLIWQFSCDDLDKLQLQAVEWQSAIDIALLWEVSVDQTIWSVIDLAAIYFNNHETANVLIVFFALIADSIYFNYQIQSNRMCRATDTEIKAAQHKKQQQSLYEAQFNLLYQQLIQLICPDSWSLAILEHSNSIEYKVLTQASTQLNISNAALLAKIGLIDSIPDFMVRAFMHKYNHAIMPNLNTVNINNHQLPLNAKVQAFSIDDSNTTEIDDAFSLQATDDGWLFGIHIAAPALQSESLLDIVAARISTIYYPGNKITMLPAEVIAAYSLLANSTVPVISLYIMLNAELDIMDKYSVVERIFIKDNLRIEQLEVLFNADTLTVDTGYQYEQELKLLYALAIKLESARTNNIKHQNAVDYSFIIDQQQHVQIKQRVRDNPIDKLVSETMILANSCWGRLLTNSFVPALYRVKQSHHPVYISIVPAGHSGLNIDFYTWSTSPLRRAVDFINQTQLLGILQAKPTLAANNIVLLDVASHFDEQYAAFMKFQDEMEHYWSLQYLLQENISTIEAIYLYKDIVQLVGIPIKLDVAQRTTAKPPGSKITLLINNIELIDNTFSYQILA